MFALANTGVPLTVEMAREAFTSPVTQGVVIALAAGKLIGIVLFAWLAVRMRISNLIAGVRWPHVAAIGLLGGIGFTVSLFISDLAFAEVQLVAQARIGILVASLFSGLAGYLMLHAIASPSGQQLR